MTTFVLVPGAWLGGWAWREVTDRLRGAGQDVYPLTLTGLAERAAEGGPETDLDTHVADIVRVLDDNDLRGAVLVAHSYAGAPVAAAVDRRPERLAAVVYVDSGPVPDGVAQVEFGDAEGREATEALVKEQGEGWKLPPIAFDPEEAPALLAGLDETDLAELREGATPHPYGTMTQPVSRDRAGEKLPHTLIACTMPLEAVRQLIDGGHPFFAGLKDATLLALPTGHWPMLSDPDALAEMLATVV